MQTFGRQSGCEGNFVSYILQKFNKKLGNADVLETGVDTKVILFRMLQKFNKN
jgi:hypothetical protein